ncbi:MAG: GNAT family N-acetyltransferase [Promethearchaeota archaeon]
MSEAKLTISEMKKDHLPFLIRLWRIPKVMKYADEFPRMRGWTKSDDLKIAWTKYKEKRSEFRNDYIQLILHLNDDLPIGESFIFPLPEAYTFGKWRKPDSVKTLMGDIKLLPQYWGQGLGTHGMKLVVHFAFAKTSCGLFVVPPHRHNPAAIRVYEKAGFTHFTEMRSWRNHKIMEMTKEQFEKIYT